MAPNKKKRNNNNNNKKKGVAGFGKSASRQQTTNSHSKYTDVRALQGISNLPSLHHLKDKKQSSGGSGDSNAAAGRGGYYEIYKQATTRFWNWMKETLPSNRIAKVNDLSHGVRVILETNIKELDGDPPNPIVTPVEVLQDLSTSIHYREVFTQTFYAESGDKGHKYMIDVLKHCRKVLKVGRLVAKVAVKGSIHKDKKGDNDQVANAIGGRFAALLLDDDEEEEEPEEVPSEDDIRQGNIKSFQAPEDSQGSDMDIEEMLINGDDRFQAIALIRTMDDLMGVVDQHYELLKNRMQVLVDQNDVAGQQQDSIMQLLAECTVVANMATEDIHIAFNALTSSHPHLSSWYHILALVFMPEKIAELNTQIPQTKLERDPHIALQFLASIIECSFHNTGGRLVSARVNKFSRASGLPRNLVEKKAQEIHFATNLETQLDMEIALNPQINQFAASMKLMSHSWFKNDHYIGGDRCILNTHKIIQMLMDILQDNNKLVGRPGFWGKPFKGYGAQRIRGDMDEALAGCIMPELLEICRQAPFDCLPDTFQLITVLELLQQHLKGGDRTRPVSIALTFGMHAMVTSMFVLQGNNDLEKLASYTKATYNRLFQQLDSICDPEKEPQNAPNFYHNVATFKNLVNFAKPAKAQYNFQLDMLDPAVAERLAFWNPLIGGEYLLYGIYICSIGLGSATVDSLGQLRFTLHLYHAMKQQRPGSMNVPFLEQLDKVFATTKAVWVGGRPEKGSYAKHFWIAWGMSLTEASKKADDSTSESRGNNDVFCNYMKETKQQSSRTAIRELGEILPEEYSSSYRRIVAGDFSNNENVAEYTVTNADKGTEETIKRFSALNNLLIRVNTTRDSMDDDEDFVIPVNFSAVGTILLEFTNALSEHHGWDAIMDQMLSQYPEIMRTGKTMGGKKMKAGGFNASDLNLKRQGMAHFWASLLSRLDEEDTCDDGDSLLKSTETFIEKFFQDIPKERYRFFVEKTDDGKTASIGRKTPLDGDYPQSRNGISMRTPLQGFVHFKYSKAGKPSIRFIKPGKYTPYAPSGHGYADSPYKEPGFLLKRSASGKFRHIASYTMEELVAMGWDGAMYPSKGNHAANGHYVPFIAGYDSDEEDRYDQIDVLEGKRAGTIGLPPGENGRYMTFPDPGGGRPQLVQIKNAR